MANPDKLDFADWFSIVGTALVTGIGGAMAWFNRSKRDIYTKLESMEDTVKDHATNLAVLQTSQENTEHRLEEIVETTRDTNHTVKELGQTIMQLLLDMKSKST